MRSPSLLCAPDGSILAANRKRLSELPFFLSVNRPDNSVVVAASASSDPLSLTISGDGPAEIVALSAKSTGAFLTRLELEEPNGSRIPLSNGVMHSANIFGNNTNPYWLPEPIRIQNGRRLVVNFTDLSGAANTIRLCLHASQNTLPTRDPQEIVYRQIQAGLSQIATPFFLVPDMGSVILTASQVSEQPIALPDGCNFFLKKITGVSTGDFTLDIIDANTGESLIDAPQGTHYGLANNLIVGTAQYPFELPFPRLFTKNQKIILKLTDTSVAGNTIRTCLAGRLVKEYVGRPN